MNFTKQNMLAVANSPAALNAFSDYVNSADAKVRDRIYRIITEAVMCAATKDWVASVVANGGSKAYPRISHTNYSTKV